MYCLVSQYFTFYSFRIMLRKVFLIPAFKIFKYTVFLERRAN